MAILSRRQAISTLAGAAAIAALRARMDAQRSNKQLLLIVDGLRPDFVSPDLMPRLHALGRRGVVCESHHSVFPTVTRVNSSSIATGCYPETHGLLGNTVYSEKAAPGAGIDTSDYQQLEAMLAAEGQLLTAPALGAILREQGRRLAVFSAGSSGSALLLASPADSAAIVNVDLIRPTELRSKVIATVGTPPERGIPNRARNRWTVDAYLSLGLGELAADITAIWFGDPDATAHEKGVSSPLTAEALRSVDEEIGRIEDELRRRRLLESTNMLVTSDHGFSTHSNELKLASLVAPFAGLAADGKLDIVVTEGAINFRGVPDARRVGAVVAELQRRPEVGAIFTRAAASDSIEGVVEGTLALHIARWAHARSADILVSANWDGEFSAGRFAGRTTQGGVAGHGTSSPFDIHNTFVAAGPGFKTAISSRVPTSNVDLAPTLLALAGMPVPQSMAGRVVREVLQGGPDPESVQVVRTSDRVRSSDGSYELTAYRSSADGRQYLDYTEVGRRPV